MRAAVYCRISEDRTRMGLGVERQLEDCRAYCDRRGWEVTVYVDNDVSAYRGKTRPDWQRLVANVEAGRVDAVVSWHLDRLTRSPRELEDLIDLSKRHGLVLATATGVEFDLADPWGRAMARNQVTYGRVEVEVKAMRQHRQRRQAAEQGRVNGGGTRGYGYDADRVTVRADEAEVIREAARRVLAGESLASLCKDFTARDVRTPTGRHWVPHTMRRLLGSARISGRREHAPHDTYAGTRPLLNEITAAAVWPAVISAEDSDRLRMLLSRPGRRPNTGTGRRYLLSGILRCGQCGHGMAGRPKAGKGRYVCPPVPGGTACGRTTAVASRTDDLIRDVVLVALEGPELQAHLARQRQADPTLVAAVARDRAKLVELSEAWADDKLPMAEWKAARQIVEQRLQDNQVRLERISGPDPLGAFVGSLEQMLTRWEAMNLSQRRAIVGAVVEKIVVHQGDPYRWDPHRFEPVWR